MDEAVTLFIDPDGASRVVAGPEPITEARKRLAQTMADKKAAPGMTEIWSRRGVTDRFVCREPDDETEEIQEPLEPFEQ